jgi:hypothetical protein
MNAVVEAYRRVISEEVSETKSFEEALCCSKEEADMISLRLSMLGMEEADVSRIASIVSNSKKKPSPERIAEVCEKWCSMWSGSELLTLNDIRIFDELEYVTSSIDDFHRLSDVNGNILSSIGYYDNCIKIVKAMLWNLQLSVEQLSSVMITYRSIGGAFRTSRTLREHGVFSEMANSFLARLRIAKRYDELKNLLTAFQYGFLSMKAIFNVYDEIACELIARKNEFIYGNDKYGWRNLLDILIRYCDKCCSDERPGRRDETVKVCYEALDAHKEEACEDNGSAFSYRTDFIWYTEMLNEVSRIKNIKSE